MNLPTLEEETIMAWTGQAAYKRGQQYAQEGRVLHPRREGNVLLALCQGQAVEPYRVRVRLGGEEGILSARCTCPVGAEGRCKHVAAVLILWRERPHAFRPLPSLAEELARWPKKALIDLVLRMIEREPDLREMVYFPFQSPSSNHPAPQQGAFHAQSKRESGKNTPSQSP